MSDGCLPDHTSRSRRSWVVLVVVVLVIMMLYSLVLLYLQIPVAAAIAVLSAVATVTSRLARPPGEGVAGDTGTGR